MKITLIENGVDSLTKGFENLKVYEEMHFIDRRGKERFFILKDAILSINHGIEILLKQVLLNHNDILIYTNFDKVLKSAFIEKRQNNLESIFQVENSPHTVTLQEAIERLSSYCDIKIEPKMLKKLKQLEKYRNQITHSAVFIQEEDINETFNGLIDCVDSFFLQNLKSEYSSVSGYSELKEKYDEYLEKVNDSQRDTKREAIEKLIEAFNECGLSMGQNEAKIITDINIITKVLIILKNSNLKFGADFYNNHCTGHVGEIKRLSESNISIYTEDNQTDYRFKCKSMMIYLPKVEGSFSPIIFFEAAEDSVDKKLARFVKEDFSGKKVLSGIKFLDDTNTEYDPEKINDFYYESEIGEIPCKEHYSVINFLTKGICCFFNIQGLNYGKMAEILDLQNSLKEIQVHLNKGE